MRSPPIPPPDDPDPTREILPHPSPLCSCVRSGNFKPSPWHRPCSRPQGSLEELRAPERPALSPARNVPSTSQKRIVSPLCGPVNGFLHLPEKPKVPPGGHLGGRVLFGAGEGRDRQGRKDKGLQEMQRRPGDSKKSPGRLQPRPEAAARAPSQSEAYRASVPQQHY